MSCNPSPFPCGTCSENKEAPFCLAQGASPLYGSRSSASQSCANPDPGEMRRQSRRAHHRGQEPAVENEHGHEVILFELLLIRRHTGNRAPPGRFTHNSTEQNYCAVTFLSQRAMPLNILMRLKLPGGGSGEKATESQGEGTVGRLGVIDAFLHSGGQ